MPTHSDPKIDGGDIPGDILIVDDETANLKLLKALLSREGYQVRAADRPRLAINSALDGRFTFVNDAIAKMFDFDSPELMIDQGSLKRWRDPGDRARMLAELQKHGRVTNFEAETLTHKDRQIHVLFSAKKIGNDINGMVMDITDRKQAEQNILDYQQRLKALASQLTIAEEKERRAIAVELHDQISQSLALARLQLASARKMASESTLADKLADVSNTLLDTLEDTQLLMLKLSSSSMHETGFSAAISDWLETQIGNRYTLKTEFIDNIPKSSIVNI